MSIDKKTVIGMFVTPDAAESCAERLESLGYPREHLSVLMTDPTRGTGFRIDTHSKVSEGAVVGGSTLGIIGALIGSVAAMGGLTVSGVGLVAAGPIVGFLSGFGAGAATGGIIGAFVGLGLTEHEAKIVERELDDGAVMVGVETNAVQADDVKAVMEEAIARQVWVY